MRPRSRLTSAILPAVLLSALACGTTRAQEDAIDSLLSSAPPPPAAAPDEGDRAPQPAAYDPLASTEEQAAPPPSGVICRTMTDMLRRSRKERICMPRAGWEALIRVARAPGPRAASGGWSGRRSRSAGR